MNSGFLGIPLMKLLGGSEAMNLTVIFDQFNTFIIFTMGIIVVSGGFSLRGVKEMVKSPLLWAIGAGFLFRFLRIPLPEPMLQQWISALPRHRPWRFSPSDAASPNANSNSISISPPIPHPDGRRILRGSSRGQAPSLSGAAAQVVIVASALPSAVFSFVLPLRYGVKPQYAGSLVFVSTVLGIVTVPLSISLAEFFIG
jgi:predicted permease